MKLWWDFIVPIAIAFGIVLTILFCIPLLIWAWIHLWLALGLNKF